MATDRRSRALHATAFVGVVLVLDFLVGSVLGTLAAYADPKTSPVGALESARTSRDAEMVVLGGSRANHHIDPEALGDRLGLRVHNAGVDGQGPIFARAVQELMWSSGIRPAVFLLQLQAFDVMAYEPDRALVVARYIDDLPATRARLEDEGYNVQVKLTSRSFRYNSLVLQLVLNRLRGQPSAGTDSYGALDGSLAGSPYRVVGVPGRWTGPDREVSPPALEVVREFVRAAVDSGAVALVVTGPFLRGNPIELEETVASSAIARVVEEEGGHWLLIDEERYPVFEDPALYFDPTHLNREGAAIYTEILGDLAAERLGAGPAAGVRSNALGLGNGPADGGARIALVNGKALK